MHLDDTVITHQTVAKIQSRSMSSPDSGIADHVGASSNYLPEKKMPSIAAYATRRSANTLELQQKTA